MKAGIVSRTHTPLSTVVVVVDRGVHRHFYQWVFTGLTQKLWSRPNVNAIQNPPKHQHKRKIHFFLKTRVHFFKAQLRSQTAPVVEEKGDPQRVARSFPSICTLSAQPFSWPSESRLLLLSTPRFSLVAVPGSRVILKTTENVFVNNVRALSRTWFIDVMYAAESAKKSSRARVTQCSTNHRGLEIVLPA